MTKVRADRLVFILVLSWPALLGTAQSFPPEPPQVASMLQLLVTPEKFEGKRLRITGFLILGQEADRLYSHQEDERNGILENSLRIQRTRDMDNKKATLTMKYVRVIGWLRQGRITDVERCELWSDPDHPFHDKVREIPGVSQNM